MRRQSLQVYFLFPCAQMPLPPHSLHWGFCLPCGQMELPPHSLHCLLILPCGQMRLPPHSLHVRFSLPCGQMALPPHSLHWAFRLPCGQMPLPPHSLQCLLILPCGQIALPPHSLHLLLCLPCSHFGCFRPLPSLVEGAPRFRDAVPSSMPSASSGNVRSSVCGSKPLGPLRISGSHALPDGSGLIGFAAAEEEARPHNSYATTSHSSSIAEATLPRRQPTNVSIPDLEAHSAPESH